MVIFYRTSKLEKLCNSAKKAVRKLGPEMAEALDSCLTDLDAFDCLADVPHTPPYRRHAMTGDRQGQFSVDLVHPYRLYFIPANDPVPRTPESGVDMTKVTEIEIVDIDDPH